MDVEINFAAAAGWIEQHETQYLRKRNELRRLVGSEKLDELKKLAEKRNLSEEAITRKRDQIEFQRRCERDRLPIADKSIPGFFARSRKESDFRVSWGNNPGKTGSSRIVTWRNETPLWTCTVNHCVTNCWIASTTGDCVAQIEIREQGDRLPEERRSLFVVISPDCEIREHFQLREQIDNFLGIDETASNYAWSRKGRTSLSRLQTHEEWHRWLSPGGFCHHASFRTPEKRVRLYQDRGTVVEFSWEDSIEDPVTALENEFAQLNHPSEKLRAVSEEWNLIAVDERRAALGTRFLNLLESIPIDTLSTSSWYGWGIVEFYGLRADVLWHTEGANLAKEAQEFHDRLVAATVFPTQAIELVKSAVASADEAALTQIEARIKECISDDILRRDPKLLAKVWRAFGHLEEGRGNIAVARSHFDTALEHWGEVGCLRDSRRLAKIID